MKEKIYSSNPSIFQRYISLTNQKNFLIEKICKVINENYTSNKLSLLDIGCGDGTVTLQIISKLKDKYNLEINAIDVSKPLIECFKRKKSYTINYIIDNVELIKILPKADFILMSHILTYINNLDDLIEKVLNALNLNGIALIVLSNDFSDDVKVKNKLNKKLTTSHKVKKILDKKNINYKVEIIESEIDISGIENMDEDGRVIIEFFKHKSFEEISNDEINDIREKILKIANSSGKITKKEDYIWIKPI